MEIVRFISSYLGQRSVTPLYSSSLTRVGKLLESLTGPTFDTINADKINRHLQLLEIRSPINAANTRRQIKTIWTAAYEQGHAPPVGILRRIKVPKKIPNALRLDEIAKLIETAQKKKGNFRGTKTPRRIYWSSLFNAYYDTALRVSDLRSVERQWIAPGGIFSIVQSKPNRVHHVRLRAETLAEIDALLNGRTSGPIWQCLNRKNFFKQVRNLFDEAKIRGSSRWIRRASASYVEKERPGTGWRHLGHAKPGLAETAYLDPSICAPEPVLPPPIFLQQPSDVLFRPGDSGHKTDTT